MHFKKLEFTNDAGQKLSARIDLPEDDQPVAYALFAHCFTCSKNIKAASHISRALTREGIAVFRFDFTGLGESSNVDDLVMAAEFMAHNYEGPKILISM
jgi:putative redox protein